MIRLGILPIKRMNVPWVLCRQPPIPIFLYEPTPSASDWIPGLFWNISSSSCSSSSSSSSS